ncbi:hypothetical protein HK100_007850, partial [Physocladia obscura]
ASVQKNMYYNPILELEEALFEDNPLQSRPVKSKEAKTQKPRNSNESKEAPRESEEAHQIRLLTEGFQDYDFTKIQNNFSNHGEVVLDTSIDQLIEK